MREEASTHNEVFRMMKFEQERLADGQRLKEPLPAGLPKVHLFKVPNLAEEAEPITVGHCDPGVHDALNLGPSLREIGLVIRPFHGGIIGHALNLNLRLIQMMSAGVIGAGGGRRGDAALLGLHALVTGAAFGLGFAVAVLGGGRRLYRGDGQARAVPPGL